MGAAMQQFPPQRDYSSLSIADLLDARDAWHVHLTHLQNVVATAIGKYRILRSDWYFEHPPNQPRPADRTRSREPRTLENSGLRPWSWPCVLVFVREWAPREAFGASPDQMVPRALFLSDGRIVPTCVVLATGDDTATPASDHLDVAANLIYGGAPAVATSQGQERVGSLGALVSDGRLYYALTNEHDAGAAGTETFTYVRGRRERVGVTAATNRRKIPFERAYPGWAGSNAVANLDAGLIAIDDIDAWTPSILELGPLGEPVDLVQDTITFDLLEAPVRAYGAASGLLLGQIEALFYRYKSAGGVDYITDFLIGPRTIRTSTLNRDDRRALDARTRPGDSGTLWCLEFEESGDTRAYRPFALQWGGHVIVEGGTRLAESFALAANLTTICREFDVDIVRDWVHRLPEYWGDVGHYTIAAKACALVETPALRTLLQNNLTRISYADADIDPKTFKGLSKADFVPLADVPDKVWKRPGPGGRGGPEHPNHFADMDKPRPGDGATLLDLTAGDAAREGTDSTKVTLAAFRTYYDSVQDAGRGLLPFRVEELFDILSSTRSAAEFVCAAGVLAHYVGDACQPLHISYLFDGIPAADGGPSQGQGVHTAYETKMLNAHAGDILIRLNAALGIGAGARPSHGLPFVADGHGAAVATVQLMRETFAALAPKDIVDAYIADPNPSTLYDRFGAPTIDVIANGCGTLAMIYDSAWRANPWQLATAEIPEGELTALYLDKRWAPSRTLDGLELPGSASG